MKTPYRRYLDAIFSVVKFTSNTTDKGIEVHTIDISEAPKSKGDLEYTIGARREIQQAFLDILKGNDPIPPEMRGRLAWAFENICAGVEDEIFIPYKRSGPPVTPVGEALKFAAFHYKYACDNNVIIDHNPKQTIAEAYGVNVKTVENWLKKTTVTDFSGISDEFSMAKHIEAMLKINGLHYKKRFKLK